MGQQIQQADFDVLFKNVPKNNRRIMNMTVLNNDLGYTNFRDKMDNFLTDIHFTKYRTDLERFFFAFRFALLLFQC